MREAGGRAPLRLRGRFPGSPGGAGRAEPSRAVGGRARAREPGGVAGGAGARRCVPLGMVSKGPVLRLVTAINRRRMKLLMGLAFVAYAACE